MLTCNYCQFKACKSHARHYIKYTYSGVLRKWPRPLLIKKTPDIQSSMLNYLDSGCTDLKITAVQTSIIKYNDQVQW